MKLPVASALAALLFASAPLLCAQAPEPAPAPENPAPEKKPDAPATPEKPATPETTPAENPPESPVAVPPKPAPKPPKPTKPGEPLTTRSAVDSLTDAELDQVISLLKENYINPDALSEDDLKRASVQGIIDRIAPGAAIVEARTVAASEAGPFRAEILDARIGYARLGATAPRNLGELDAALANFTEKKLGALVLDLRATPPSAEFEQTAEVCRRFCPQGKVLFSVKKPNIKQEQILTSKDDPKYRGIVVVLVDRDTAGNAEIIASVLRTHIRAMIIGQRTKGEAVGFAELPLAGGKLLRVAVAEIGLPDNVAVFPGGVKPDLAVEVPQETTNEVLKRELEKGVGEFVFETERARMNEAALVAGTNPELDAIQALQKNKGERPKPPLRDVALQRAVDFITTIAIYEKKPAAGK
ncbi:MAG: S41 family peptidase [Chthoniobacter sp.]|nr:S41 family peptidase [Chthoniobacter sp.]